MQEGMIEKYEVYLDGKFFTSGSLKEVLAELNKPPHLTQ